MSGVPLETCWTFNKLWNNKFYYKAAFCWYIYWRSNVFECMPVTWQSQNQTFRTIYTLEMPLNIVSFRMLPKRLTVTNVSGRYRYSDCVQQEPLHYLVIFFVLLRGARRAYSYLVMRRSHSSCLGARGYFRLSFPCGKVQAAEVRYHSWGSSNTNRL